MDLWDGSRVMHRDSDDPMEIEVQEAIARLIIEQNNLDLEMAHYNADKAICDLLSCLGYDDVVKEWEKVGKWYA